jgi:hypothetical protein
MARRIIVKLPRPDGPTKKVLESTIVCPRCNIPRANTTFNFPKKTDFECRWCLTNKHSEAMHKHFDDAHETKMKHINAFHQNKGIK